MTLRKSFVCTVLAAALVAAPLVATDAAARKRGGKQKLQVIVDGKKFKPKPKLTIVGAYEPTVRLFTMSGTYTKVTRRKGTIKNLVVSCGVDLATAALPITISDCTGTYSDNTYTGLIPGTPKGWVSPTMNVTFESFDGTSVKGTFEGTLEPGGSATAPAVFTGGQFSLRLLQ